MLPRRLRASRSRRPRRRAPAHGVDDRRAVVRHDERLAVPEEARRCRSGRRRRPAFPPRPPRPRPCRSSRPPRRARRRPPAGTGRAAAARSPARCGSGRSSPVRLRPLERRADPVAVVRPGDDEVCVRDLAGRLEQVLDPFAGRDPADVEDQRRGVGDAELRAQSRRSQVAGCGSGKPLPRTCTFAAIHAARDDVVAFTLGCDDDRSRAARHAAVQRRVERALEQPPCAAAAGTCRAARRRTGRARSRHHAAVHVVTGSRKPNTCTTSGRCARASASGSVGVIPIQR